MIKQSLLAAALAVVVASPAAASQCPRLMAAVDQALASAKLDDMKMNEVKMLRTEGEALHKAGKHQDSVDTLAKAMKILDIK